jgi:hypothetical protein
VSETVKRYIGGETKAAGKARWATYADLEYPDGDFVRYTALQAETERREAAEARVRELEGVADRLNPQIVYIGNGAPRDGKPMFYLAVKLDDLRAALTKEKP